MQLRLCNRRHPVLCTLHGEYARLVLSSSMLSCSQGRPGLLRVRCNNLYMHLFMVLHARASSQSKRMDVHIFQFRRRLSAYMAIPCRPLAPSCTLLLMHPCTEPHTPPPDPLPLLPQSDDSAGLNSSICQLPAKRYWGTIPDNSICG